MPKIKNSYNFFHNKVERAKLKLACNELLNKAFARAKNPVSKIVSL